MINWIKNKYNDWHLKSRNLSYQPNVLEFTGMTIIWLLILVIVPSILLFIINLIGAFWFGIIGAIILIFLLLDLFYKCAG